jgi:Arm DNA-binding domain
MALLTELQVRNAKARDRAYKLFDERGLFLLVTPTGSRLWRLKYHIGNREKLLSLGIYPDVPLKRAREKRDEARRLVADEIDPSVERKGRREAMLVTFEGVAQEWLELQSQSLSPETLSILGARLNSWLYPYLGSHPIGSITAVEVLAALRKIETRGRHETAPPGARLGGPGISLCSSHRSRQARRGRRSQGCPGAGQVQELRLGCRSHPGRRAHARDPRLHRSPHDGTGTEAGAAPLCAPW